MSKISDPESKRSPLQNQTGPAVERPDAADPADADGTPDNSAGMSGLTGQRVAIGLGILATVLLILSVVLWSKLSARDTSLVQAKNRSDQTAAGVVVLQASLSEAKNETVRVLKQKVEAETETTRAKAELANAKAGASEVQEQLQSSRASAVRFQAQGEESTVASIKQQGEAELARTQAMVAKTQLAQAKSELSEKEKQRTDTAAELAALRTRLERADADLVAARKLPARK